jgi:outer membrane murein-binding lipoprotein Lpp
MHELHDEVMEHVGKVIHDYYDKKWPDSRGGYGDNIHANAMVDEISEQVKELCVDTQSKVDSAEQEIMELESERDSLSGDVDEAAAEIENLETEAEWKKMVEQFWYYSDKTNFSPFREEGRRAAVM